MSPQLVPITVAQMQKAKREGPVKAFADVQIGEALLIKGFRVVDGKKGLFVSPPRVAGKDGRWYDQVQLLDDGLKAAIVESVMQVYQEG